MKKFKTLVLVAVMAVAVVLFINAVGTFFHVILNR